MESSEHSANPPVRKILANCLAVIGLFLLYRYSKYFYAHLVFGRDAWNDLEPVASGTVMLLTGVLMAILATRFVTGTLLRKSLGVGKGFVRGLMWGLISALPMLFGFAFYGSWNEDLDLKLIYRDLVLAGIGEEFIFRGFLFGLLFYYCGFGYIPATLVSASFFAFGHLYQAGSWESAVAIWIFTTMASAGFGWFYLVWRNIWFAAFLHGFMDLTWDMFSINEDVTGNGTINVFRLMTIGLAVGITLWEKRAVHVHAIKGKWWRNKIHDPLHEHRKHR